MTVNGTDLNAALDQRFGRAAGFLLVDTSSGEVRAVDNDAGLLAVQGAGVQAAEVVARLGAEAVITGHCGPKAFRALTAVGINIYTGASGSARDALDQFERGELAPAAEADVSGHWA